MGTFQILSIAFCSSAKTPVAPTIMIARLVMVATSAFHRSIRTSDDCLKRCCAIPTHELTQLIEDLALGSLGAEEDARYGGRNDDERCDREDRVEGNRRTHTGCVVFIPGEGGFRQKPGETPKSTEYLRRSHVALVMETLSGVAGDSSLWAFGTLPFCSIVVRVKATIEEQQCLPDFHVLGSARKAQVMPQ